MDKRTFQNLPEFYLPICILVPALGKEVIAAISVAEVMMVVYLETQCHTPLSPQ